MTNIPVAHDMTDWTDESAWAGTRAPLRQSTGLNPSAYVDELKAAGRYVQELWA